MWLGGVKRNRGSVLCKWSSSSWVHVSISKVDVTVFVLDCYNFHLLYNTVHLNWLSLGQSLSLSTYSFHMHQTGSLFTIFVDNNSVYD